jgi:hypothetical protein
MPDDARYGTWCFDCHKPALAADFVTAIAIAIRAGWRRIRDVWRCPECAALDDAKGREVGISSAARVRYLIESRRSTAG